MLSDSREEAFQRMLLQMHAVFWDTDISRLEMDRNAPYIIARLLNMGCMAGYCWVKELYSDAVIRNAVMHRRDLRPVVRSFMAQQYGIPQEALTQTAAWR